MDQKIVEPISAPKIRRGKKSSQTKTLYGLINLKIGELTARIPIIQLIPSQLTVSTPVWYFYPATSGSENSTESGAICCEHKKEFPIFFGKNKEKIAAILDLTRFQPNSDFFLKLN